MVALPYTLTNGSTADASEVHANFVALRDALQNIKNSDIASSAAIDKSKLAQSFKTYQVVIDLVPAQSGTVLGVDSDTDVFTIAQTDQTEIKRHRIKLRSGQMAYLCAVEWHVERVESADGDPRLDLTVDGVQVGGQVTTVTLAGAYYLISNANPIDDPLLPITNDSVFIHRIGASAIGADTTLAGVTCTLTIKAEVVP